MPGRAGYRFVPFGDRIVSPPTSFDDLRMDTPHPEGSVSGTLEVTWKAETPVCIGIAGQGAAVEPFEIDGRGCLPGASLRGMLRSVMEIAGFCHLGPINEHRHFGFRDFSDAANYRTRVRADAIKAGWLTHENGDWVLTVAAFGGALYPIDFDSVLKHIGNPVDAEDWRGMDLHEKRTRLASRSPNLLQSVRFEEDGQYYGNVYRGRFADANGRGRLGHVVSGGAATDRTANRDNEVFVGPPSIVDRDKYVLDERFMDLFHRINAHPGRGRGEPTGAWRYWLGQKAPDAGLITPMPADHEPIEGCGLPGIPVFFCCVPQDERRSSADDYDPKTVGFVMGLSRAMKIPYREGVGDVAGRLYEQEGRYRVPKLRERLDLARAIFGWLDEAEGEDREAEALAGRVAFSPAFSARSPQRTAPEVFVFGPPRESFYRFYLDGHYHGGDGGGRPVGRKRYPVRSTPNHANLPNDNPDTQTPVSFHACGTTYSGRIRVHNLHPVELAALVWCLTFGEVGGPWRHAIGRAKGFGYGRLRLERLAWARPPRVVGQAETTDWDDWDAMARTFEAWMSDPERLGCTFTDTETIRRLRAYANPHMGDRHLQNLSYPPVEDFKGLRAPIDRNENWQAR